MKSNHKKIAILCNLDNFANSIRPLEIEKYLKGKGHEVILVNNLSIYRRFNSQKPSMFSYFGKQKLLININKLLFDFFDKNINGWPYYFYFILKLKLRALILNRLIRREKFDVIICENNIHGYLTLSNLDCTTILDLDSPYVEELYFTGKINEIQRQKINKIFRKVYRKADYLNFHWYLYTNYVKKNIYNGNNIIEVNYGCNVKDLSKKAKYNAIPKIICLGYLGGKWVNLPLLSKLSKLYPIDVYGGPPPDKKWGLNYKGYAPTLDVIKDYQFGLITISKDKLRKSSFSSKHLDYLSYGLPVLTPEWRQDHLLKEVSIYYKEDNFMDLINQYSDSLKWQQMSNRCYRQAKAWQWKTILKPLGEIVSQL